MVVLYSRCENCESNHWLGTREECYKGRFSGKLVKARSFNCEEYGLWLYKLLVSVLSTKRVKRIIIAQPFKEALISLLLYYFFNPKYVLVRLLKFLFVKRTLNFLSVITSYFVYHWYNELNFRNCKNLFRSSLSVSFIECFLFLRYSNIITNRKLGAKVLPPNSRYKFLHTLFSFSLRLASFRVMFIDE